jgi:hypothetical protein
MSQPCSALELAIVDAHSLEDPMVRGCVALLANLGIRLIAIAREPGVARLVDEAGLADTFALWLSGDGGWPFDRALAFTDVEPQRALFLSPQPDAGRIADALGIRPFYGTPDDLAPLLL